MYFALIRSTTDYGCEVYNFASYAVKKLLDNIQLQTLRICTGSMKSASLFTRRDGWPPYEERRKSLIAKFFLNISSFENNHPTKITLQDDVKFSFYNKNIKSKQKPYYITAQEVLKKKQDMIII